MFTEMEYRSMHLSAIAGKPRLWGEDMHQIPLDKNNHWGKYYPVFLLSRESIGMPL